MTIVPHSVLSRRGLLIGAGLSALGGALAPAGLAHARAPMIGTAAPAVHRFKIGAFEATAISDGPLVMGEPSANVFKGLSKEAFSKVLGDNFLPTDVVRLDQNVLVVNTGEKLVLFDTGVGSTRLMGDLTGRMLANLKAAGVAPADIDAVVLTHAHPDHCWGLMGEGGLNFPNAQIYMSQTDLEFWTDPAKASMPGIGGFIEPTRKQLLPNRERIVFVKDGQEVLPGIEAIHTPGHTVGHTSYVVTSDGKALCVAGDIVHHHVISLETPKLEFAYDTDGLQSVASRLRMLDMLANRRIPMLAYHFPWPGIGYVSKHGDSYKYVPAALQTVL